MGCDLGRESYSEMLDERLRTERRKIWIVILNQLCYTLGWGLYWYQYGSEEWKGFIRDGKNAFGNRCLDYYCSCVELRQKSICTFLLCWNRSVGVKDVGHMIGKMVWEGREDNLLKGFEFRSE
jgi:hypothetical protein